MRGRSRFPRKTSIGVVLATFVVVGAFVVFLIPTREAFAQGDPGAPSRTQNLYGIRIINERIMTNAQTQTTQGQKAGAHDAAQGQRETKAVVEADLMVSLQNTATIAMLNGLNFFAQKIAYDMAVYVAAGGKGQVPLIFDSPGNYFEQVGKDTAGEVFGTLVQTGPIGEFTKKYGVNLCVPKVPRIALNIKLGFLSSLSKLGGGSPPTPRCSWDSIRNNWDTFTSQSTEDVLDNVGVMFSPGESSLGSAIEINSVALQELGINQKIAELEQEIGNGFKPVVDKISGKLKTPSVTVEKTFNYSVEEGFKVKDNTTTISGDAIGAGALGVLSSALQTFAGVLTDKLTKKIFEKGFISVTDMLGLRDGENADDLLTFDGQPPAGGRSAAELANATLLTPNILTVSSYNELLEFASCPNEGRTPSTCVIDQQFFGALSRAEQGATVTLRQAIQQGFLNGNWQLLPLAHQKNLSGNCYNEAFCYSNLVKLRKARVIPIGWELAANSPFNDVSRPVTLNEAMDRFDDCPMKTVDGVQVVDESKILPDPLHPWCHLVDPEWVLKYPAATCRQRGPGPTLASPESSGRASICVDVATCVAEDASGNCVGGYGYCVREKNYWQMDADACPAQFASCTTYNRAGGGSFSFLSNTLDGAACNSQNAGCRQYSLSQNAIPNAGFEDVLGGEPRDWTLVGAASHHRGSRLSMRGSSALGVSGASTARTRIAGLLPGTSYRLSGSVLQELENTSARGKIRLAFLNDAKDPISAAPNMVTTCPVVSGGTAVELEILSSGLGYLTGSCEVTLPSDAVGADVTLSTNSAASNLTWFDEIGLFGGSFSTSPYDAVFLNSKAEKCADDQAGCSMFSRLSTGTLNMLRNPSFEDEEGGLPAFWNGASVSGYENSTLLGHEGISAYALSNTPITQSVDGILADASYSFSVFTRRDGSSTGSGTARIELRDSDSALVAPSSVDGCDRATDGAIIVNLLEGSEYARTECHFSTPAEAASAVVSLSAVGGAAPRLLADAVQLELAVRSTTFHEGYSPSTERVFLKKAPEGLDCVGANPSAECQKYAPSCRREEVGCNSYRPTDGGSAIPAVTTDADVCPVACAGYDTFRQEPSNFSDVRFPLFLIPPTAESCRAAEAGCSEFTNIERLAEGGESREYFTYLRLCAQPGPQSATYYTWEGAEELGSGIRLRSWDLLRSDFVIDEADASASDPTGGTAPCTQLAYDISGNPVCDDDAASVAEASCSKGLVGLNPDCREFYDVDGNIHYRLYSKTVVSTADCKAYRITATTTEPECEAHGGFWRNGECRYDAYAPESVSCRAEVAGCRAYSGNASRNVRVVFTDTMESLTTDGWVAAPGGGSTGDVINSNESIAAAGHSLKITRPNAFKDVSDSIRGGRQYILTFWAKGVGDLNARFSDAAASSFTFDSASNRERPVSLTSEWKPYQIGPVVAVRTPASDEQLILERVGSTVQPAYIDNIELREVAENIFLIEDSWKTPAICDQTPAGGVSPQYMLGCRAYDDKDKVRSHFKSFEKLCRPEAVGCEALYDSRNSDSPYAQTFNAVCTLPSACTGLSCTCKVDEKAVCEVVVGSTSCRYDADHAVAAANVSTTGDTARVAADGVTYLVNDPRFRCESSNMGCTELGDRTMNPDRLAVQSWGTKLLKNLPSSYATTLCKSSEEYCQAYTRRADSAQVYFKDPDTRTCEFREGSVQTTIGVLGNGWFRKGSDEPCDPDFLQFGTRFGIWRNSDARYEGWVGTCRDQFDMCKEFIDPEDRSAGYEEGRPYYVIMNDRLDTSTCQGRVSLQQSPANADDASACVLFRQTDNLKRTFDAKATYEASELANGSLVAPIDNGAALNTANIVVKVKRDRQCGEWLDCRSSENVFNPTSGQYQSVCTAFSLCAEYETVGSTTRCIRYVESSFAGQVLSPAVYATRDVSWKGMEYSGYGIPNRYPVEELVTVNVSNSATEPDMRLVRLAANPVCTQDYGNPCGPGTGSRRGTCLGPDTDPSPTSSSRQCVYPIDGGARAVNAAQFMQPQALNGYPAASCRIYPQADSPFPSTAAGNDGWNSVVSDDNNGNPVLIGASPAFANANICQRRLVNGVEVSSCECNYVIASYSGMTKYMPAGGADLPTGYCEGGTFDEYECDPLATGPRSRNNLSCCSVTPPNPLFGDSFDTCGGGGTCNPLSKIDRVVGYEGQCLERDFTMPINGRSDEFACVTWRPVGLIGGSRDIYNQNLTAGYFAPPDRRFYCSGTKEPWAIIMNINPEVGPLGQVTNKFFGHGTYNNRVDNFYSEGLVCNVAADAAGGTRWCIYPGLSVEHDISFNADPVKKWVLDSAPIGILGCYEVSDPNNDAVTGGQGPAEIIYPYIGPPIYRDQLQSIFFQVTDDIYHFNHADEGSGAYYRGADGNIPNQPCDDLFDPVNLSADTGCYDNKFYTDNGEQYKIIIPDTKDPQGSDNDDGHPEMELIATNPNQNIFADCNDEGGNNIDSANDAPGDSKPYREEDVVRGTQFEFGISYLTEENKWQVDASDHEGKIGFFAHFDDNNRLKDITLQAETGRGAGSFGINSMGFVFKAGCKEIARVDVPGEFGLTQAYTNVLNPVRNFDRSQTDPEVFVDGFPFNFTSYSQACVAYGAVGGIGTNPPRQPWTYVAATERFTSDGLPSGSPTSGVEHPLQCTDQSFRKGTLYNPDIGSGFFSVARSLRNIFLASTNSWLYREISTKGKLAITGSDTDYDTSTGPDYGMYDLAQVDSNGNLVQSGGTPYRYDETRSPLARHGGVVPPRIAAVDPLSCDTTGRCRSGLVDSVTISGRQDGLVVGADGSMNVTARFFAWASHNAMPIIRRTILWGDSTPNEPATKGWYKNQKPFCSPDTSDTNAVGECRGIKGLSCTKSADCPGGISCDDIGVNNFGNTPGACNAAPYQFDHTYVCSNDILDDLALCDAAVPATNAPCRRLINESPVCVYRPKVQIVDNWGWCNCTGACTVPGGLHGADCNLPSALTSAKPWTEFNGEIRLAPPI